MLPARPGYINFACKRTDSAGHPGSKQLHFIIFRLCRFIPAYPIELYFVFSGAGKAGLSRYLPAN
jgi:hypothetical protein